MISDTTERIKGDDSTRISLLKCVWVAVKELKCGLNADSEQLQIHYRPLLAWSKQQQPV